MNTILFLIILFTFLLLTFYFLFKIWLHDLTVKERTLEYFQSKNKKVTNVLFIYPHPDDETMASGGLINQMVKNNNFNVTVISTSHGEKGNELRPDLSELELGNLRKKEFENSMKYLGVKNFEMWDFSDGEHLKEVESIKSKVKIYLEQNKFDLIVTYEKHGLYGHPDHIILSRIITELKNESFRVIYSTLPTKILNRFHLPTSITLGNEIIKLSPEKVTDPNIRINIGNSTLSKYFAAKNYRSQNLSHGVPLWVSVGWVREEYYFEGRNGKWGETRNEKYDIRGTKYVEDELNIWSLLL